MINIKTIKRLVKKDNQEVNLYYGAVRLSGRVTLDQLAKRISNKCTVTRPDCLAVLSALQEEVTLVLQQGQSVSLGELGNLRLTCSTSGAETEETFETSLVKNLRVVYAPSSQLRHSIRLTNPDIRLSCTHASAGSESKTLETA